MDTCNMNPTDVGQNLHNNEETEEENNEMHTWKPQNTAYTYFLTTLVCIVRGTALA